VASLCITLGNPYNLHLDYIQQTHVNGFMVESLIWYCYIAGLDDIEYANLHNNDPAKRKRSAPISHRAPS